MKLPTKGQKLVRVTRHDVGGLRYEVEDVEVTKVGTRYFYVAPPEKPYGHSQHYLEDWSEGPARARSRDLYESRAAWDESQEHKRLRHAIAGVLDSYAPSPKIQQVPVSVLREFLDRIK